MRAWACAVAGLALLIGGCGAGAQPRPREAQRGLWRAVRIEVMAEGRDQDAWVCWPAHAAEAERAELERELAEWRAREPKPKKAP